MAPYSEVGRSLILGALLSAPLLAADLDSLVQAERDFAKTSVAKGIKPAFLAYLADDAMVTRPRPVNGKEFYSAQPDSADKLQWEPEFAGISAAGDLGFTTGPWLYQGDGRPDVRGHYVSVWRKQSGKPWKVVFDTGIHYGKPYPAPSAVSSLSPEPRNTRLGDLAETDRRFCAGEARALSSSSIRVYRNGSFPSAGPAQLGPSMTDCLIEKAVASGGLGYTYGTARSAAGEEVFFRIWAARDEGWRAVVDLRLPLPAPK
jgi:ketosteroid isomerase-like protein